MVIYFSLNITQVKSACFLKGEHHMWAKLSSKTAFIYSVRTGSELFTCFLGEDAVCWTFPSSVNGTEELHSSVSKPVVNFH